MKLSEIKVGEHYAVHLDHKTNYEDAEHENTGYIGGLPGVFLSEYYSKILVVAVGVPYRKGHQGVRIEYRYGIARRCPMCGDGFLRDPVTNDYIKDERTNQVTVHSRLLLGQWDEWELGRSIESYEWKALIEEKNKRRMEEELAKLLEDDGNT